MLLQRLAAYQRAIFACQGNTMNDQVIEDLLRPNHSTGPRTEEGKRVCRFNAVRHGLTGQLIVFTPQEHQAYDKHCKMILGFLLPIGDFERDSAQSIADDRWRLKRARSIEASMFALGMAEQNAADTGHPDVDDALAQARTWRRDAHNLHLLTIYEQRIQRAMDKNTAHFKTLQAERKEAAQEAMREAKLLLQLAQAEGKPSRPEPYFRVMAETRESVFSAAEIDREMRRDRLLQDARNYNNSGRLPEKDTTKQSLAASPRSIAPISGPQPPIANPQRPIINPPRRPSE